MHRREKTRSWIRNGSLTRVARWYIFIPKIPIWVNFGGPWNGKGWYVLCPFGIFYGQVVYVMVIW
jgi:hypothetical protein